VGGGSAAIASSALLGSAGKDVRVLTRRPNDWSSSVSLSWIDGTGEVVNVFRGQPTRITDDPATALDDVEAVLICAPVHAYQSLFNTIVEHLPSGSKTLVGSVYGQGGLDWMLGKALRRVPQTNAVLFSFGLIPWVVRTQLYGDSAVTYGPKEKNLVFVEDKRYFSALVTSFLEDLTVNSFGTGTCHFVPEIASLTFSVDNQIIHPSRLFALNLANPDGWQSPEEVPFFYRDWDEPSSEVLAQIDKEFGRIRGAIRGLKEEANLDDMMDYLSLDRFSYGSSVQTITESFRSSVPLKRISTPTVLLDGVWRLDPDHRFFLDDIEYGLEIAEWFGSRLEIDTPRLREVVSWAKNYRALYGVGAEARRPTESAGRGTPDYYGIQSPVQALASYVGR
jgi:opine dehydrogenase